MSNIVEVLNDISKAEDDGAYVDSLVLLEGQSPSHFDEYSSCYETDHDQRKKQLILNDPVHTIVLKDYLQSQVRFENARRQNHDTENILFHGAKLQKILPLMSQTGKSCKLLKISG